MGKIVLYHGTPDKEIKPTFGRGNNKHDYGCGFYLTDNIDILEKLLSLGGLGIQYCIKSKLAYSRLHEIKQDIVSVEYSEFNNRYNKRDIASRKNMYDLINSDENKVTNVFSTLFER